MKSLLVVLVFLVAFGCLSQTTSQNSLITINQTTNVTDQTQPHLQNQSAYRYQQNQTADNQSTSTVLTADTVFPELPKYNFSNVTTSDNKLIVYYFYSPYCEWCIESRPIIDRLKQKYNTNVSWMEYNILTQNGTLAYIEMANDYGFDSSQRTVPRALVNNTVLSGVYDINTSLEKIIETYQNKG